MNAPYMGKFSVSQAYQGAAHDGLDLVGVDSKEIHSTVDGIVVFAGWENPKKPKQGFGRYVKIQRDGSNEGYYFGHLSELRVSVGDRVRVTQVIGVEGSTGNATGSHCHYCVRVAGKPLNVSQISGIPNRRGTYDDGYRDAVASPTGYHVGTVYRTKTALNVRSGPGTNYAVKPRAQLTADGQSHAYEQTAGVLKPGTSVRCLALAQTSDQIWMRIPSGWVCAVEGAERYIA